MSTHPSSPRSPRIVLSVDPSIRITGYGIFHDGALKEFGRVRPPTKLSRPERIHELFREVVDLIQSHGVHEVAVEKFVAFYRNSKTSRAPAGLPLGPKGPRRSRHDRDEVNPQDLFLMQAAQTAVLLAGLSSGCEVFEYAPSSWKGRASMGKKESLARVAVLWPGLNIKDDNISDALLIGRYHLARQRLSPSS